MRLPFSSPHLSVPIHQIVPEGSRVRGEMGFSGGLLLQGRVEGTLLPTDAKAARVVVGPTGVLEVPSLEVDEVVINGRVQAQSIKARRVILGATAHVTADIHAQAIEMHTGARFDGRMACLGTPIHVPARTQPRTGGLALPAWLGGARAGAAG